jgi:(p)ppGpp synthase/HD superfamily hydrolase
MGNIMSVKNKLQLLRLKEMDPGSLTLALMSDIRTLANDDLLEEKPIFNALHVATFLHRNQTRANRKNLPRTPYIEHPLRNALRLLRWGCTTQDIIVAALLHDTIEDCVDDIILYYIGTDPAPLGEQEKRDMAVAWMAAEFGPEVARIVLAVSNGFTPEGMTKDEKRLAYAKHVAKIIEDDPAVFLVKFSDFVDNALGLYHNNIAGKEAMIAHLAVKYYAVVSIFAIVYEGPVGLKLPVDAAGFREIGSQIRAAESRLKDLLPK